MKVNKKEIEKLYAPLEKDSHYYEKLFGEQFIVIKEENMYD